MSTLKKLMAEQSPESQERIWAKIEKMRLIFLLKFLNNRNLLFQSKKTLSLVYCLFRADFFEKQKINCFGIGDEVAKGIRVLKQEEDKKFFLN
ncbi:hypothetical protein BJP41_05265 [Candidatus Williamhamiltonella defendens]|uniref:Uncharacterized protein n=1 Tax=Candidatus Williamhamiltonella defendens TaxID=138072 RepID=A0A2D3T7Q3_9ENTR|nr:hypothetical protein [Candidatus Hamiltonella defensa]ATW29841.1 hypothetical protein BJP41_05265 [Candidatus Hamiltonella defensa]ATW31817.1 hypothetical protein BJP42_05355 [Candidatus Hamiltonella defensa]